MARTTPDAAPVEAVAEKLIEVRLLRNYVPESAEVQEWAHDVLERDKKSPIYIKRWAGEVLSLPRTEAKRCIDLGIAQITADLI
jgi:hypothetical protein